MATTEDYAQLALHVYAATRDNEIKPPNGWTGNKFPDDDAGFSYGIFKSDNEIVIAFTGTNESFTQFLRTGSGDWATNLAAGADLSAEQMTRAKATASRKLRFSMACPPI